MMPRLKTSTQTERIMTPVEMLQQIQSGLKRQAIQPNVFAYRPHNKQEVFHKSEKKKKLYIGGNRSGKTTGSVVEDIYWLRGQHPYRKVPEPPIRGRCIGVDFVQGVQKILLPQFKQWVPPSLLINGSWEDSYNRELRTLTLTNDSFVEFMSYDQDPDKFSGTSRHFCHYDEEPPLHVFNECNARLVDTNGDWWISMTPVDGMTWIYDTIYLPGSTDSDSSILVVEADMLDNPHISKEAAESYLSGLDKNERAAREHGVFVELGGRVYKSFLPSIHVIPYSSFDKSKHLSDEWGISLDHGFNNPTAILWHAADKNNNVITFDEHYEAEMLIEDHAKIIHEKNKAYGKIPEIWVADPALAQRQGITGVSIFSEYADKGCYFVPGNNDVSTGVARVNTYLRVNPLTNKPKWLITDNCVNLIREMQRLRWRTYSSKNMNYTRNKAEQIHKKDDHATDSARYYFSFLPDLSPQEYGAPVLEEGRITLSNSVGTDPMVGSIDEHLKRMVQSNQQTQWKNTEATDLGALEYD